MQKTLAQCTYHSNLNADTTVAFPIKKTLSLTPSSKTVDKLTEKLKNL